METKSVHPYKPCRIPSAHHKLCSTFMPRRSISTATSSRHMAPPTQQSAKPAPSPAQPQPKAELDKMSHACLQPPPPPPPRPNNKKGTSPLYNRMSVSSLPLCSNLPIERLRPLAAQVRLGKLSRAWQRCSCSQIRSRVSACEGCYRNGPDSSQSSFYKEGFA